MKLRWYISTFIIILTLLGVVDYQQNSDPNQEIVLQFTNTEVSSDDTQNTIANIKEQLESLGVDNIQVSKEENGKLIITYYSDIDAASVKETLTNEIKLALNSSKQGENGTQSNFPLNETPSSYNLDVYDIQKDSGSDWDLNGTFISEIKPEGNRFSNPNFYAATDDIESKEIAETVAYKTHCNIAITIDDISYKIPEVRAGPST